MYSKTLSGLLLTVVLTAVSVLGQQVKLVPLRTITVVTEPKATIWIDDILRGETDETGKLVIKTVPVGGTHKMRVRANSFKEISVALLPAQKGDVKVKLVKTTDQAELAFQEAEMWSLRDREKAVAAYRKAISLRPKYAEAQLNLARILSAKGDNEGALQAIAEARKARPVYPEASAVEGRIYKSYDEEEKAIAAFNRSITEGKGFQPEAHAGLGLLYKDKAGGFAAAGDFQNAEINYALAAAELRKSITQLSATPDAKDIYQLLGDVYYRAKKYQDAIRIYEEFIAVFPDSPDVPTVRSLIVQTRKEMDGSQ